MEPTLESLSTQILEKQSTQDITYAENTKYTGQCAVIKRSHEMNLCRCS